MVVIACWGVMMVCWNCHSFPFCSMAGSSRVGNISRYSRTRKFGFLLKDVIIII